jgi:hypothetical protein
MKIKQLKSELICSFTIMSFLSMAIPSMGQENQTVPIYHIYAGNPHSHSIYTSSHGAQWAHLPGETKFMEVDSNGVSQVLNSTLKPDWEKLQGPPSSHYALAKANGYDFYAVTDHSQESDFYPTNTNNPAWLDSKNEADEATDSNFVAIRGFEYSENNGPGGKGHLNVYNTASYLNALQKGMDLPFFYKWLETVPSDGEGVVVTSFNHPGPDQYDNWNNRTPEATDIITMLEVINSNNKIHYLGFINALDKGWKVSPICGNDNHGFEGITSHTSRTFVLATDKSKLAILDAMKNRRTYASLDNNIQCKYTVNGKIMGSTLEGDKVFKFDILISDSDTNNPKNKITKIDIVKDNGEVVKTYEPANPDYSVHWSLGIYDATSKYFFVRIYNAGGGDAPGADAQKPIAWLAPVWTGR